MSKKPFYITTAIAYTSAKPHIGNTYEIVLSDAIARHKRQQGYDVYFQTGTDEHGQKIEDVAKEKGIDPKTYVDEVAAVVKESMDCMNVTYDNFVRTTDPNHKKIVQEIFKKLYDQGDIYKGKYEGLYCKPCESFWTENQLADGKCPDCGGAVIAASEEAYFFDMKKYAPRLIKYIEEHPDFILPESRKNEMVNNFLKPGLLDLCVSRTSFNWGIPVDFDDNHVVYVWIDALSNYITSLGFDVNGNHGELYKKFWPADVQVIGKDILRFHTIYWPIMLMALDQPLPKHVFAHPWLLIGEEKMSKSKGNVIYADDLTKEFGVDAVRYFMLHEMPYGHDGTLTYELLIERINSDLANVLGNLVNRTVSMQNKYFGGVISIPSAQETKEDKELKEVAMNAVKQVDAKMEEFKVADAISEIFVLLRRANKYIDETTPWVLGKDESQRDRLATVMYNLLESIRIAAVLLESFLPDTSEKILEEIGTSNRSLESIQEFGGLEAGRTVDSKPEILFARIDEEEFFAKQEDQNTREFATPLKDEITIDDFMKIDLRVGTIISCEKHPKADKLLVEQIDIGGDIRQVVSGIAEYYKPKDLVGKQVIVVANLKPVTLRGVESQGMILCAADEANQLTIATIQKAMENGTIVR